MGEPLWGFLFDLPPFRRVVGSAVAAAVAEESRAAHEVIDRLHAEHRRERTRWEERLAASQRARSELRQRLDELKTASAGLREALEGTGTHEPPASGPAGQRAAMRGKTRST